jgi:formylglycine-generating enzyme required for sulfatase activity
MLWLDGATLFYVPEGAFTMGTGAGNSPEKTVSLDGFWIYSTVVTNKMYTQCVATGNCAPRPRRSALGVHESAYGDFQSWGHVDMAANYCAGLTRSFHGSSMGEAARMDGAVFPWGIDGASATC